MHVEYSPEYGCNCCVLIGDEDVDVVISRAHAEGAVIQPATRCNGVLYCLRPHDEPAGIWTEPMVGLLLTCMKMRGSRERSRASG